MSALGVSEFERWYERVRATLPWLPRVRVTDDLPIGTLMPTGAAATARVGALEPDGRIRVQLAPETIPGEGTVWHEAGHVIQRVVSDRLGAQYGTTIGNALWAAEQRAILGSRVLTTVGGEAEGFAAIVSEAFAGLVGGYYAEPVPQAQAAIAAWDGSAVRRRVAALGTWTPTPAALDAATPVPQGGTNLTETVNTATSGGSVLAGCDVAAFQGAIDFDLLRPAAQFVIVKATEGIGFVDPTFARNWAKARLVGMVRGAYHFARPDLGNKAEDEADYFINIADPEAGDLLALDYEVRWDGDVVWWCAAFCARVRERVGVVPLVYLNLSLVRAHDWRRVIDLGAGLWLASYDGSPNGVPQTPWPVVAMKQWTSSGTLPGIPSYVDRDTFFGTREQLARYGIPGGDDVLTREQFDQWFREEYERYGVAATFDALKQIQAAQARHTHKTGEPEEANG